MWFLPIFAALVAAPPKAATATASTTHLPPVIRQSLDQEYPGWKLAPVTAEIQAAFTKFRTTRRPSLTVGDFDHDGYWDYVVQIALSNTGAEEQIVIAFLARSTGYEENILQSMGLDPNSYLWVKDKDTLKILGGMAGETTYKFEEGRFQEADVHSDPEHPDPSIPHPPVVPL